MGVCNKKYGVGLSIMFESNGNVTYFAYVLDNEKESHSLFESNELNYSSHQSKHFDFKTNEPLKRVIHDLITLCKFFNLEFSEVRLPELSSEDLDIIKQEIEFWRL